MWISPKKKLLLAGFGEAIPTVPGTAYGGGYYIGDITDDGIVYALIVSPKASGENLSIQWKTSNTDTAGTLSDTNGPANTEAMNNSSHPAAFLARGLNIGGFNDWYVPARNELLTVYNNKDALSVEERLVATTNPYWTSTRGTQEGWARIRRFSDGAENISANSASRYLRSIRRIAR